MRTVLLATSNPHKLDEVRQILAPTEMTVLGLDSLGIELDEPVEDGGTFAENARIKALYYAGHTGRMCLADDSGLACDGLGGAPGIHSARYSGVAGPRDVRDLANNEKLVSELASIPDSGRSARFICAMCFADPEGRVLLESTGTFEGVIVEAPRGTNGFGYDPHFLVPSLGRTAAELSPEEKNELSHRGRATANMLALFRSFKG